MSLRRANLQKLLLISVLGVHCGAAFLRRGPDYQIGRYSRRGDRSGRKPDLAAGFGPARLALFLGQLGGSNERQSGRQQVVASRPAPPCQ